MLKKVYNIVYNEFMVLADSRRGLIFYAQRCVRKLVASQHAPRATGREKIFPARLLVHNEPGGQVSACGRMSALQSDGQTGTSAEDAGMENGRDAHDKKGRTVF